MVLWMLRTIYCLSSFSFAWCGWPKGTYGLPKPRWGCPSPDVDGSEWQTGKRVHMTELGSKSSENSQLAGSVSVAEDRIIQEFCIKFQGIESMQIDDEAYFMPGKYCIFKKGICPNSFMEGWIYWDDGAPLWGPTFQTYSGAMPDGVFDRNTKISYCCRTDGNPSNPIILPSSEPFFLLKYGAYCQEVTNMEVEEQWILWYDEKTQNMDASDGRHPAMIRESSAFWSPTTKLFYCYYKPAAAGGGGEPASFSGSRFHSIIVAGYVIGSVVGFVLVISIVLTAVQRALMLRQIRTTRNCRTDIVDRGCGGADRCRDSFVAIAGAADNPPPYDVAVMDSPVVTATATTVSDCGSATVPLVASSGNVVACSATARIRPPSYTEFLEGPDSPK